MITDEQIESWFTYHSPSASQKILYDEVRSSAKQLAYYINTNVPISTEKTQAIEALRVAVMWANAAIACNVMKGK